MGGGVDGSGSMYLKRESCVDRVFAVVVERLYWALFLMVRRVGEMAIGCIHPSATTEKDIVMDKMMAAIADLDNFIVIVIFSVILLLLTFYEKRIMTKQQNKHMSQIIGVLLYCRVV